MIEIKGLKVYFPVTGGRFITKKIGDIKAVDDVSLSIGRGEILGLVGESGCGKTTLAKAIVGLVGKTAGDIIFEGTNLDRIPEAQGKSIKKKIQMVFQDPYLSLNPRLRVCTAIAEGIDIHKLAKTQKEREERVIRLMEMVELKNVKGMMYRYPTEFSAGQRQRMAIARALSTEPSLLLCDEPVSSLDVSVQHEILKLLLSLREKLGLTILFITHDLAVVEEISDKVAVMYLGKILEYARKEELFSNPRHPYTKLLLSAVPIADPTRARGRKMLESGEVLVSVEHLPQGCRFHPRCPEAEKECGEREPEFIDIGQKHFVTCKKAAD